MIEFALAFLVLATIVLGAIDLGRAFFTWSQVKNAAREGAAYAERDPSSQAPSGSSCANPNNIRYRAQNESGSLKSSFVVTTRRNGTTYTGCPTQTSFPINSGDTIEVKVETDFDPLSPFAGAIFGEPTISADVEVVVQ